MLNYKFRPQVQHLKRDHLSYYLCITSECAALEKKMLHRTHPLLQVGCAARKLGESKSSLLEALRRGEERLEGEEEEEQEQVERMFVRFSS